MPGILKENGRLLIVVDGIKVAKQGKKMPAVKLLHQESDSNTKAEFIMGHSHQSVSLLVKANESILAVPLAMRIHESIVLSNRDKRTLPDKMLNLMTELNITQPLYCIADAYYCSQKIVSGLLKDQNHLVTRAKTTAVAYRRPPEPTKHKGRPRVYGQKVPLRSLFSEEEQNGRSAQPSLWREQCLHFLSDC